MILSVVVVNWNTGHLLKECLESVYLDLPDSKAVELFVVDNASTDGSADEAVRNFPGVTLIRNKANPGFAAANNQAIERCTGEYILLLNPDTRVHSGALITLVRFLSEHPEIGAAGPRLLNPDGSLQHSCSAAPSLHREFLRLFHLGGIRPDGYYPMETWPDAPHQVDVLKGACIIARRGALEQVGGFDTDYFMYTEEVDLCLKFRRAGWTIWWMPQAKVTHYGGQSTRLAAEKMFVELYRSKIVYFRRNHGRAAALVYKLIVLAAGIARIAVGMLAFYQPPAQRTDRLDLARNYRRLISQLATL